jgi:hypothetical protein
MEGRHVGLDFYDLLIEALKAPVTGAMSVMEIYRQPPGIQQISLAGSCPFGHLDRCESKYIVILYIGRVRPNGIGQRTN